MAEPSISQACDVLIVGAGPTGLVLAAELARHGASFRIIDAAPGPTEQSRAIGIQARTLELLQAMGLADTFVREGLPIHAVNLYSGAKPIVRLARFARQTRKAETSSGVGRLRSSMLRRRACVRAAKRFSASIPDENDLR